VDAAREPLLVLDGTLHVVRGNRSFHHLFQVEPRDTTGRLLADLENRQWHSPRLQALLEKTRKEGVPFDGFDVDYESSALGKRRVRLNGRPVLFDDADGAALIVLGFDDVTEVSPA